jgi:hypothetical protein
MPWNVRALIPPFLGRSRHLQHIPRDLCALFLRRDGQARPPIQMGRHLLHIPRDAQALVSVLAPIHGLYCHVLVDQGRCFLHGELLCCAKQQKGHSWHIYVGVRNVRLEDLVQGFGQSCTTLRRMKLDSVPHVRRRIGTFNLLAQKLVFCNSDLDKWTTICKVGDLEVSPKPFWIWKLIHVLKVHVYEVYAHEVHAHEVHACEVHAYEGFCEDLARQNTVAHLSQLQLWFRRRHIWVSILSHIGFNHRCSVPKVTI